MARSILNATKIAAVKSLLAQGASIKNVATRTGVTRHRVQTIGAGPSEFKPSPRDPDWRAIDAAYADGKGRGLTKLWLDYCAAQDWPLAYSTFLRRRALWIAAGRPSGVAEPLPKAELSPPVRRGIAGPSPEAPAPRASILIASGLAFIDAAGVALRVRRGALSVRFPDGAERHFQPGAHRLKTVILAGAGCAITADAIDWHERQCVALLIARKAGEGFALFSTHAGLDSSRKALALRRKQFAAPRLKISHAIVARKILSYALEPPEEKRALTRLSKALSAQEIMSLEGRATRAYWQRWAGFPLAFRDKVPPHWRAFQTRVSARFLRTARTAAVFSARGARHPINAMLNYTYAVALAQITRAIIGRGLDPVYGFLHADRIGRLSFSYDILELFRAQIDALIFDYARGRKFNRADFAEVEDGVIRLSAMLARQVAALILRSISFHDFERAVASIAELF